MNGRQVKSIEWGILVFMGVLLGYVTAAHGIPIGWVSLGVFLMFGFLFLLGH